MLLNSKFVIVLLNIASVHTSQPCLRSRARSEHAHSLMASWKSVKMRFEALKLDACAAWATVYLHSWNTVCVSSAGALLSLALLFFLSFCEVSLSSTQRVMLQSRRAFLSGTTSSRSCSYYMMQPLRCCSSFLLLPFNFRSELSPASNYSLHQIWLP